MDGAILVWDSYTLECLKKITNHIDHYQLQKKMFGPIRHLLAVNEVCEKKKKINYCVRHSCVLQLVTDFVFIILITELVFLEYEEHIRLLLHF